jgi:hypothetical protein
MDLMTAVGQSGQGRVARCPRTSESESRLARAGAPPIRQKQVIATLLLRAGADAVGDRSIRQPGRGLASKLRQRELILSERRVRVDREAMRRLWGCPICEEKR